MLQSMKKIKKRDKKPNFWNLEMILEWIWTDDA